MALMAPQQSVQIVYMLHVFPGFKTSVSQQQAHVWLPNNGQIALQCHGHQLTNKCILESWIMVSHACSQYTGICTNLQLCISCLVCQKTSIDVNEQCTVLMMMIRLSVHLTARPVMLNTVGSSHLGDVNFARAARDGPHKKLSNVCIGASFIDSEAKAYLSCS